MRRFSRLAWVATALVATIFVGACGAENGGLTGIINRDTTQHQITLVGLEIRGDTNIVAPDPKQFHGFAKYSDGHFEDVTPRVNWGTSAFLVADVTKDGLAIPHNLGSFEVRASFDALPMVSFPARVVGTHRRDLPAISDGGWEWVLAHNRASNGALQRFAAGQVKLFVGIGYNATKVMKAAARASALVNGELTFVQTTDSTSANIPFTTSIPAGTVMERCASGSITINPYGAAVGGFVRVVAGSSCIDEEDLLLHELLHALGFMGHIDEPGVMSSTEAGVGPNFGPRFTEIARWVYGPGMKPAIILMS